MSITEAERQLLIALIELAEPFETPNNTHYTFHPRTLEQAAAYFLDLREDWTAAYAVLSERGWIEQSSGGYVLTQPGLDAARRERLDHPPIWYWYRKYYRLTAASPTYSRFCEELYGRDLCQTSFSDMAQLDFLVQRAGLGPSSRVLDIGCGKGLFAEYLSDCTGARAWGVDYIPEAIDQALERTQSKRDRLSFTVGNLDHLDFPTGSFDRIISIDTLYMPNDLPATLARLDEMLAPGGKLLVYYTSMSFDPSGPVERLSADGSDLAIALREVGLPYRTWDFSDQTAGLMRRKRRLAAAMRELFETEGTLFLYNHLMAESLGEDDRALVSRYLYEIL